MNRVTHIGIHHTAGPATQTVEQIRDYHERVREWRDIGYGYLLRLETDEQGREVCRIYVGRPHNLDEVWEPWEYGAHVKGWNGRSIGIALIGTYDEANPPPAVMRNALVALLTFLCNLWGVDPANILGHREFPEQATVCPGVSAEWLDQVRAAVGWMRFGEKEGKA